MMNKPPVRMRVDQYFNEEHPINGFGEVILTEPFELHWHEFYELTFVYEGQGVDIINGRSYETKAGVIQLLSPSDFHEVIPGSGSMLRLTNIHFKRELIPEDVYGELFGGKKQLIFQLTNQEQESLKFHLATLHREFRQQQFGQALVLKASLDIILVMLARLSSRSSPIVSSPEMRRPVPHWLRKVLPYLENHYREDIGLKDAAALAGLSPGYFSDRFHKATGTPFQRYILDLRLEFAYSLLRSSHVSVTEACFAAGFNTLTYFESKFKNRYGFTPKEARGGKAR